MSWPHLDLLTSANKCGALGDGTTQSGMVAALAKTDVNGKASLEVSKQPRRLSVVGVQSA